MLVKRPAHHAESDGYVDLPSNLNCFRFTEYRDSDFARVCQGLFDCGCDIASELRSFAIVDSTGIDDDSYFATRLHGKCLIDAWESAGDSFEFFQSLDVAIKAFASSPWT